MVLLKDSTGEFFTKSHPQDWRLTNDSSLYTQAWDASYATNVGQWRGKAHYTIQQNAAAANSTDNGDVSCPSDIAYLSANGAAFCSAYLSYNPSVSTVVTTTTPATSVVTSVETDYSVETAYSTFYSTSIALTTTTVLGKKKRALQTPASASTWSPSRLSKACSAVATGSTTTTATQTAATPLSTFLTTQKLTSTTTIPTTVATVSTSTLTTVLAPKATSLGPNLLNNPGFEQDLGGTTDWYSSSGNLVYRNRYGSAAYDGLSYMYVYLPEHFPSAFNSMSEANNFNSVLQNGRPGSVLIQQDLTDLSTSDSYTLSFHYQQYQGTAGSCNLISSLGDIVKSSFVITNSSSKFGASSYHYVVVPEIVPSAARQTLVFEVKCSLPEVVFLDAVAFQKQSLY